MKIISSKTKLPKIRGKSLKWGVVGCGRYLENNFLPTLDIIKRSKLISVYSSKIERAKNIAEKFAAITAFDNYDEFLKSDINAIYISSENYFHPEQVIKAAENGKHILCEKPIAINYSDAEKMINTCKKNNVNFFVNYRFRYHPLVKKAKEIFDNGKIGKLIQINSTYCLDISPSTNFRFKKSKSGGGAMIMLGTHLLDILFHFGGEYTDFYGYSDNVVYKSEVEDFATAHLKFKKGGFGCLTTSYNATKAFNKIEIIGHNGSLVLNGLFSDSDHVTLTINFEGEAKKTFRKKANEQAVLIKGFQNNILKQNVPTIEYSALMNVKFIEEFYKKTLNTEN